MVLGGMGVMDTMEEEGDGLETSLLKSPSLPSPTPPRPRPALPPLPKGAKGGAKNRKSRDRKSQGRERKISDPFADLPFVDVVEDVVASGGVRVY
jgi:hypothetical protein